ncbi:MAG: DUF1349 domain-containing protein [Caldilineaceae bacterium]|nr:DUF1349 domain-containing protein [Caldilineaceae bacterium]MBP8106433.1 DUF1349 domain-containing protein [Caldilineaceae bacterium]MBP8123577.1 DUF1349 domain-containing protein [Caldilineaceae bacterium]MBP9072038.1 DUF1349 domain-containing protein [Caldilineaceae bacterium]
MTQPILPGMPGKMQWTHPPVEWQTEDGALTATAGPLTDLFTSPGGDAPVNNSPRLLAQVAGDFLFSARVIVDFRAKFDAGVLILYAGPDVWAKLCFEFSPLDEPTVVSVVTRGLSDDCNSVVMPSNQVYLRVARMGDAFGFHYSVDGVIWHMVRYFSLGELGEAGIGVGVSVQSPTGEGCTAVFDHLAFSRHTLGDMRSGE